MDGGGEVGVRDVVGDVEGQRAVERAAVAIPTTEEAGR